MVRTTGSKSFTAAETSLLLDIVEKIRPLGRQKWDVVAAAYNDQISGKEWCTRDAEALKRRFMVLAYAKKPSEEWREFMDRAGALHQSILDEAGASPGGSLGSILRTVNGGSTETDGMLLLTENEAELVHAASNTPVAGFDVEDDYLPHLSAASTSTPTPSATALSTPMRTGKRGRPPGSTTGSAAKRLASQAQDVRQLLQFVQEIQKQLREMREALATVVETQSNHAAVLAVLQQQLHAHQSSSMSRNEPTITNTITPLSSTAPLSTSSSTITTSTTTSALKHANLHHHQSIAATRCSDENKPLNA